MEASSKHSNAKKTADHTLLADLQQALISEKSRFALEYLNVWVNSHGFGPGRYKKSRLGSGAIFHVMCFIKQFQIGFILVLKKPDAALQKALRRLSTEPVDKFVDEMEKNARTGLFYCTSVKVVKI